MDISFKGLAEALNAIFNKSIYFIFSLTGVLLAIVALIFNAEYFLYGFITFAYGVVAHIVDLIFHKVFIEGKSKAYFLILLAQLLLIFVWLSLSLSLHGHSLKSLLLTIL